MWTLEIVFQEPAEELLVLPFELHKLLSHSLFLSSLRATIRYTKGFS